MNLPDSDARRIIEFEFDLNLFVEAGAGTGKTTALVNRIANMVTLGSRPVPLSEVAAITFTEKAAGELKDRLRRVLEGRADDSERGVYARIGLRQLDSAAIETIHGFARRILTSYPIESGVPPGFTVLDETQAEIAFDDWWAETLDELLHDPALESSWLAALDAEVKADRFRDFAKLLHRNWDRIESGFEDPVPAVAELKHDVLLTAYALMQSAKACTDQRDKLLEHLAPVKDWADQLQVADDEAQVLDLLRAVVRPPGNKGSRANWTSEECLNSTKAISKALTALVENLKTRLEGALIARRILPLLSRISQAVLDHASARGTSGRIEFHDLLVRAARLLQCNLEVRRSISQRFKKILVDEFQDTDPLQIAIVAAIACSEQDDMWSQLRDAEPGRLFFVGDPKQSIYRFRNADVQMYERVKDALGSPALCLDCNFRSTRAIVEWTNGTFERLFSVGGDDRQATFLGLKCPSIRPDATGPRVFRLSDPTDARLNAYGKGPSEAVQLSQAIVTLTICEKPDPSGILHCVAEDHPGEVVRRPVKFSDIAILVPTRGSVQDIQRALEEEQIPYQVDSKSRLFDSQAVRELVAILRAIEDPSDEVALLAALRATGFGCTDDLLMEHRRNGGSWDCTLGQPEGPVAEAMLDVRRRHETKGSVTVAGLLASVVRDRRFMEIAAAHRRPRDTWRRVNLLRQYASDFDSSVGGSLGTFLRHIEARRSRKAHVDESVVSESDDDAVRILTIHAAKGLEFPVVAVVGLSSRLSSTPPVAGWDARGRFSFRLRSKPLVASFGTIDGLEEEKALEALERDRLLYVAATRAKDILLVGVPADSPSKNSIGSRLHDCIDAGSTPVIDREPSSRIERPMGSDAGETGLTRAAWIAARDKALVEALPRPTRTATGIASEMSSSSEVDEESGPTVDSELFGHGQPKGTNVGRATHSVLQVIDLEHWRDQIANASAAQAEAEAVDAAQVQSLARNALGSRSVSAASIRPHWREVFMSAHVEGVLLEGFLDLIYEDDAGNHVVVDYKTDSVISKDQMDEKMERYRFQAGVYALLVDQNLGKPPARCEFVFASRSEDNIGQVTNLVEVMDEVRTRLKRIFREADDAFQNLVPY